MIANLVNMVDDGEDLAVELEHLLDKIERNLAAKRSSCASFTSDRSLAAGATLKEKK